MPVSPLAQRQLFQTANIEAVRLAHEIGGQLSRELVAKKVADDRQQEELASVRDVVENEQLTLQERERGTGGGTGGGSAEGRPPAEPGTSLEGEAGSADGLDLLA